MALDRTTTHDVMAQPPLDPSARTKFVVSLKQFLSSVSDGNKRAFDRRALKVFEEKTGRPPQTVKEIGSAVSSDPFYQLWSAFNRSAQDIMWSSIEEGITHDKPRMDAAAAALQNRPAGGSLSLEPMFAPPAYAFAANVHGQPGGYLRQDYEQDLTAGALYESGGNAFSLGIGGGARDSKALAAIRYLEGRHPGFKPKRILDLGCSAGGASSAYAAYFPDAEVHAVDLGPAMLRYAHFRAEALGVRVHFHQMDASALTFEDESFDFVVSHNMMHEVAAVALPTVFKESYRVVRPGGAVLHQDVRVRSSEATAFERFMFSWQTNHNNEPFWEEFADADVVSALQAAGFASTEVSEITIPPVDGHGRAWYAVLGERADLDGSFGTRLRRNAQAEQQTNTSP